VDAKSNKLSAAAWPAPNSIALDSAAAILSQDRWSASVLSYERTQAQASLFLHVQAHAHGHRGNSLSLAI